MNVCCYFIKNGFVFVVFILKKRDCFTMNHLIVKQSLLLLKIIRFKKVNQLNIRIFVLKPV